ncbi:YbaB/EbfC family nucleoid-associated protein [Amycolatopsis sp. FDAARGOS 1241]|uniref:YbaB/EbfC family nucleoid-associated protein n=1 Tax=Amycolatopsis sp. FDAARGOS 1241 TaxID=2778070 RepID=UPI00194F7909|nr:YbaB/EbfC family nucleoid-associated protein [Amycolatopsis sp. FDAARGOS 1241]QRP43546.1 YbaB/EbfC family nucleoid-associated protein [Amycolatopsis sp. FDAARGOS 1241]
MTDRDSLVAALTALSVDATSPDGTVTATVNTDGVLTRLHLSDAVAGLSPAELAASVLATYAAAQRESAQRTAALLAPLGTAGYVMDRLRWRAGFSPVTAAPADAPPADAPPADDLPSPDGAYVRNRSSDAPPPPAPSTPPTDDDWYDRGVRSDSAW